MNNSKYYAAGVGAYMIWGFFSFVLKPLAAYPSIDILFYRVFASAALMLVISATMRTKAIRSGYRLYLQLPPDQKRKLLLQLAGGGVFLTANWFFFIYVMNRVSLSAASFAYVICPIFTTLLAFFFLKDHLNRNQWMAVGLSVVSCLLLSFNHFTDMLYSVVVALSFALYLICQPKIKNLDKFSVLSIQIVCSAVLILPFYPVAHGDVPAAASFYLYIAIIAVLFTIAPLWLNLYALKGLKSSTLGILLYINPLMNFCIGVLYFKETISTLQILAYVIIFISVILFNIRVRPSLNAVSDQP